jgi:hypothetical protein
MGAGELLLPAAPGTPARNIVESLNLREAGKQATSFTNGPSCRHLRRIETIREGH